MSKLVKELNFAKTISLKQRSFREHNTILIISIIIITKGEEKKKYQNKIKKNVAKKDKNIIAIYNLLLTSFREKGT